MISPLWLALEPSVVLRRGAPERLALPFDAMTLALTATLLVWALVAALAVAVVI